MGAKKRRGHEKVRHKKGGKKKERRKRKGGGRKKGVAKKKTKKKCLPCICCLIQTDHPQPSCFSGPSVLGVALPGPTGVPSNAQAGWAPETIRHSLSVSLLLHC